jgi:hypothetical protein
MKLYYFLKIITLGRFPASTKKALLYPGPSLMATLGIITIMAIVQITFTFLKLDI